MAISVASLRSGFVMSEVEGLALIGIGIFSLISITMTAYYVIHGDKERNILLFWTAHANNLVDEHDAEIEQDVKDKVQYWTRKSLKLF